MGGDHGRNRALGSRIAAAALQHVEPGRRIARGGDAGELVHGDDATPDLVGAAATGIEPGAGIIEQPRAADHARPAARPGGHDRRRAFDRFPARQIEPALGVERQAARERPNQVTEEGCFSGAGSADDGDAIAGADADSKSGGVRSVCPSSHAMSAIAC